MMKLESGAIVLVNFPFTDLQSSKVRPALVLSVKGEDVIIVGIFSKVPVELRESWLKIDESDPAFGQTGLKKASIIKTEKIAVVHQSLIRKELGYFTPELLQQVKQIPEKPSKSNENSQRDLNNNPWIFFSTLCMNVPIVAYINSRTDPLSPWVTLTRRPNSSIRGLTPFPS